MAGFKKDYGNSIMECLKITCIAAGVVDDFVVVFLIILKIVVDFFYNIFIVM